MPEHGSIGTGSFPQPWEDLGLTDMKPAYKLNGLEQDCFTGWRKHLCYMERPGLTKWIKRKYNKRVRKMNKPTQEVK